MLSYQHLYHAGNVADVHKHSLLCVLLHELMQSSGSLGYFESHSGRGMYDLTVAEAKKTGEYLGGINRLWLLPAVRLPLAVKRYVGVVKGVNESGLLRYYPGSPVIARKQMRAHDRAYLCELHPKEFAALKRAIGSDMQVRLFFQSGHEQLRELIPTPQAKTLLLIDPGYDVKQEYQTTAESFIHAAQAAPRATIALWYPILPAGWHKPMLKTITDSGLPSLWQSELLTHQPRSQGRGMLGSGMLVYHPPAPVEAAMQEAGSFLADRLQDVPGAGNYSQSWLRS